MMNISEVFKMQSFSKNSTLEKIERDDFSRAPNFSNAALWSVGWLCVLEYLILWWRDRPLPAVHENLLSMAHAVLYQLMRLFIRSIEFGAYLYLWSRFAFFSYLFSDSIWSFIGTIVLIDLGYYWFHRFSHEVMLFWAIHQVHHSSHDLTVSVGLRHSPLQNLFSWIFYLPLAVISLPPSHLVLHLQLNLFYQTWIHTCAVDKLGPLEWIFNTPSHHRVHHGSTQYCVDCNYGGVFIFWDYIFGTFHRERIGENIVYGLVEQPEFWNVFKHQIFYLQMMVEKATSMDNVLDSIHTVWKGASWLPGSTRIGREFETSFFPGSHRDRIPVKTSYLIDSYVCMHLVAAMLLLSSLTSNMELNFFTFTAYSAFIVAALTNVGIIYEGKAFVGNIERVRCLVGAALCFIVPIYSTVIQSFLIGLYSASFGLWFMPSKLFQGHSVEKQQKQE